MANFLFKKRIDYILYHYTMSRVALLKRFASYIYLLINDEFLMMNELA